MFDESWHSVVEQRMSIRLDEADEARLAREASGDHEGQPLRARFGRALIVIGAVIAGAAADGGTAGRPA